MLRGEKGRKKDLVKFWGPLGAVFVLGKTSRSFQKLESHVR